MDGVTSLLNSFEPISLEQMEPVKLMDRIDKKFALHIDLLPEVLQEIRKDYFVLDIRNKRSTTYHTIYFDTPGYDCFLKHQNGKLNRYKIRSRQYVESNLNFFEVKFKSNKGRTQKDRIRCDAKVENINGRVHDFMESSTGLNATQFQPRMLINFTRITLVSKLLDERCTIDIDLQFKNEHGEKQFTNLVIVEAKMGNGRKRSSIVSAMRKYRVTEQSISKYCLGVTLLVPHIKKNNFKPTILFLEKLLADKTLRPAHTNPLPYS
jgi:hypothetical protein